MEMRPGSGLLIQSPTVALAAISISTSRKERGGREVYSDTAISSNSGGKDPEGATV